MIHLAVDGVLDGVDIAQLATSVDLVEMLHHVAVNDLLGVDDLSVDAFVGGTFHADGGQLLFEIGDVLFLLRHDDFDVVVGIWREDEVDGLQADINACGEDLFHAAFKDEIPFGISLALVEQNARLVDEVFVDEEPDQCVGFVAPAGNRHILSAYRKEEQG